MIMAGNPWSYIASRSASAVSRKPVGTLITDDGMFKQDQVRRKVYDTPPPSSGGSGRSTMLPSPVVATPSSTASKRRGSASGSKIQNYCIGKGAFGAVYTAMNLWTGETVAAKQISLANLRRPEIQKIMMEIDLLRALDHPNIVRYHGFVKTEDLLYIILEYCENGSLTLITKDFGTCPEHLVAVFISQVLKGLVYLHDQGVIHRDIKGANILTTKDGTVKLADFGVATRATDDAQVVGTPNWMAPEIILLNGATAASDIWSVGCTVIELITGKAPYNDLEQMQTLYRIVHDDHPPLPTNISPLLLDFLMRCFRKDPQSRPTARELLRHSWIQNTRSTDERTPRPGLPTPTNSSEHKRNHPVLGQSRQNWHLNSAPILDINAAKERIMEQKLKLYSEKNSDDREGENWEDDFEIDSSSQAFTRNISTKFRPPTKLMPQLSIKPEESESNWDLDFEGELKLKINALA